MAGYNNTNINKQFSPSQNTPSVQAKLYLGIESVSCRLLERMAWMEMD